MANIKKAAAVDLEDVFTQQVNANYKRRKAAREKAAKARREELERMRRNSKIIAVWGTAGSVAVLVAGFAMWFI